VTQGLRACQEPEAAEAGLGGTYFFKNEAGRKIGIVKPIDEEPLAPNNPKVCWRFLGNVASANVGCAAAVLEIQLHIPCIASSLSGH
jgi:hypothetical protein